MEKPLPTNVHNLDADTVGMCEDMIAQLPQVQALIALALRKARANPQEQYRLRVTGMYLESANADNQRTG